MLCGKMRNGSVTRSEESITLMTFYRLPHYSSRSFAGVLDDVLLYPVCTLQECNHKPPVKRVVCRRAISPYHYDQRLKALAFTLFKPLCPSYSATP